MIVLDTDHLSELQYPNSVRGMRLLERLSRVEGTAVVTTIVTFEEQMRGWLAMVNKQLAGLNQVAAYGRLGEVLRFFLEWDIVPFDRAAAERFQQLRSKKNTNQDDGPEDCRNRSSSSGDPPLGQPA